MTENHIYYMLHKENNKRFIAVLHRTVKVGPSMWSITGTAVECKAGSQPAVERIHSTKKVQDQLNNIGIQCTCNFCTSCVPGNQSYLCLKMSV
jgi:aconitase A